MIVLFEKLSVQTKSTDQDQSDDIDKESTDVKQAGWEIQIGRNKRRT